MLLIDWWAETGVPIPRSPHQGTLDRILRFAYGEHYLVQMIDGHNYEDKSLEPILSIMADEFRVHNTTMALRGDIDTKAEGFFPKVELLSLTGAKADPLGQRGGLSLCVSVVKGWNNPLPPPDIDSVVAVVRDYVTMYSLTGQWDQYKKENLV